MDTPHASVPFEKLLAHRRWVEALARRLAHDEASSDDAVQRTWMAAIENPPRESDRARGWLSRVVRNFVGEERRAAARRRSREAVVARTEAVPGPEAAVLRGEAHRRVVEAVMALPEPYRTPVLLHYFEGLGVREVAARMDVPHDTAKTRLRRGVERLRAALSDDHLPVWLPLLATPTTSSVPSDAPTPIRTGRSGSGLLGGTIVTTKMTMAVAAALLVLALIATVAIVREGANDPHRGPSDTAEIDLEAHARTREHASGANDDAGTGPASGDSLPPPVDLDAADRMRDLHGRVVDEAGLPVAGAAVETSMRPLQLLDPYNVHGRESDVPGPSVRSAVDGTFLVRLAPGDVVWMRVSAKGFVPVELPLRNAGERVTVELSRGVGLDLVVTGRSGEAVSGVPLVVLRVLDGDWTLRREATSGADGRAKIDQLPAGSRLWVAPGLTAVRRFDPVELVLPATGRVALELSVADAAPALRGRVVEQDGRGIAGAKIRFRTDPSMSELESDADGGFSFPVCAVAEEWPIEATAPDGRSAAAPAADGVVLCMARGAWLSGEVRGSDGRALAHAAVAALGVHSKTRPMVRSAAFATTDAAGRFELKGIAAELTHVLVIDGADRARYVRQLAATDGMDLGVIELAPPHALQGRVLFADDAPVARARIELTLQSPSILDEPMYRVASQVRYSDDLGRFRFEGVLAGRYSVRFGGEGVPRMVQEVDATTDADTDVVLRMPPVRRLTVTVVDSARAPLSGVLVSVGARVPGSGQTNTHATTAADGVATLLVAQATGSMVSLSLSPVPGGPFVRPDPTPMPDDADALAIVVPRGVELDGRLVGQDGAPVAGGEVRVQQEGRPDRPVVCGADGRFAEIVALDAPVSIVFEGVLIDRHRLRHTVPLRASMTGIAPGTRGVELRCETARGSLVVRIVDPDGQPVAGAQFYYGAADDSGRNALRFAATGAGGEVRLDNLSPVEHNVGTQIDSAHGWYASEGARVPADGRTVTLTYRRARLIEGEVIATDGTAVAGLEAQARADDRLVCGNPVAADGTFRLMVPGDDRRVLELVVMGRSLVDGAVRVGPDDKGRLRLVLKPK